MQEISYTGWDIGGAHLKIASMNQQGELQRVKQYATPLWQGVEILESALPNTLNELAGKKSQHAITMTAELVDIFPNRDQGVTALLELCDRYIKEDFFLYSEKVGLIDPTRIAAQTQDIGSANWHASGKFVASQIDSGLFIDIGSSTTDLLPFAKQELLNKGVNDFTRLRHDELVYTGVVRTPLMALAKRVPFAGDEYGVAAELFATTADVYRILGLLNEKSDIMQTADEGEKTTTASIKRLGRMIGADANMSDDVEAWHALATHFADQQMALLTDAFQRLIKIHNNLDKVIVAAGAGVFLIKQLATQFGYEVIEFNELVNCHESLNDSCNLCAPAVALAELNRRYIQTG